MASNLPAKLKIPSILPFANRAAQLEKFRPIVSYWCEYYIVNQILSKGLHNADDECKEYTITLMDKLEIAKATGTDAIIDDVAAKAYVEQFALETFQRADDAIHNNGASRQIIDTFQAASIFLELMSIWSPLDPETSAKIKYAKYHALRIAKAIKAGEDPNASNPVREEPAEEAPQFDEGLGSTSTEYQPPTVEEVPDSMQTPRSSSVPPTTSLSSPPTTSSKNGSDNHLAPEVSPIDPPETANSRQGSVGGGYFPSVPTFASESAPSSVSTAAPDLPPPTEVDSTTSNLPAPMPPSNRDMPSSHDFYQQQPPLVPPTAPTMSQPTPIPQHPPPAPVMAPVLPASGFRTDDEAVAQAQKHAKWAISALNFEDVPTAVSELRIALQSLGGL